MNGGEGFTCYPCTVHDVSTNQAAPEALQNRVVLTEFAACPISCPGKRAVLQGGVQAVHGELADSRAELGRGGSWCADAVNTKHLSGGNVLFWGKALH